MSGNKPIFGITMGDPSGIGPEIAAKAMASQHVHDICRPLIVGDAKVMEQAAEICRLNLAVRPISEVSEAKFEIGTMDVIDLNDVDISKLERGKVQAMSGKAAFEAVEKVIALAMDKKIDATITGPLNKEAMNLAGYHYSGHTEIYAHYTGTKDYAMMLADGNLRVIHVSTHVSLRKACDLCKKDRILKVIRLADDACKKMGITEPRIAVAGLNPHAGENGMFGDEEITEIIPAVEEAKKLGINADGPLPPDTVFSKARGGKYDIVVVMYHDQGHIPLKVIGFTYDQNKNRWNTVTGVNITLGLPIIRVSVDHGTAFEYAGLGTANEQSLINSIEYGAKLAE